MNADVAASTRSGRDGGAELYNQLSVADPCLVLFFPGINQVRQRDARKTYDVLVDRFDCPVGGVSVGGLATHETDGFVFFGSAAVALNGLTFDVKRFEDVWTADANRINTWLQDHADSTVLSLECGARDGKGVLWNGVKQLTGKIIQQDVLGQRKRMIQQLERRLHRNQLGYTQLTIAGMRAARHDAAQLSFTSSDAGPFLDGYEFWNGAVTDSRSATMLATDTTVPYGVAQDAATTLAEGTVVETFNDINRIGRVLYEFDGQTVNDIWQEYRVQKELDRGWIFSYYFLIETAGQVHAVPFSADLNVLVSYLPIDDDPTIHLVQSPDFDRYFTQYKAMLDGIGDGLPHISISPVQLDLFHDAVSDVPELADQQLDEYLITIDNNIRSPTSVEYNFPGYMVYR